MRNALPGKFASIAISIIHVEWKEISRRARLVSTTKWAIWKTATSVTGITFLCLARQLQTWNDWILLFFLMPAELHDSSVVRILFLYSSLIMLLFWKHLRMDWTIRKIVAFNEIHSIRKKKKFASASASLVAVAGHYIICQLYLIMPLLFPKVIHI